MEIERRRRTGAVWPMPILHLHPTLFGQNVLCALSLLRCVCLYFEPYNNHVPVIIDFCVITIGILIALECSFSIVSFIFSLRFWALVKEYKISFWNPSVFFLLLSGSSVSSAVWLFIRVRHLWMQHFLVLIQILHTVPSLLLVFQSLMQGLYLHFLWGPGEILGRERPALAQRIQKHLQSQIDLNYMFLVYSMTTEVAIAYHSQSLLAYASVIYMAGEVAYRLCSIVVLRHLKADCEIVNEPFQPSVEENQYDSAREGFCSGIKAKLPLLDIVCRWVRGFK